MSPSKNPPQHRPDVSQGGPASDSTTYNLYEKSEKIYTHKVEGFYQKIRLFTGWPLMLVFLLLPWMRVADRPAVLLDLPARKFHIMGLTFWPQEFVLLAFGLMIAAFALFFFTTWLGRVWCGYTCPQTIWTAIYMWAEQVVEGPRNQRMKLDRASWSAAKLAKRGLKHALWLIIAFFTSFTFVGYFYDIRELAGDLYTLGLNPIALFWLLLFTLFTYINAGWMREQLCLHICPYARFQSAMFDADTLIVSYDKVRGEIRGSRKRGVDPSAVGLGDCIDCLQCVHVCPTGIDIRAGLQYECIDCALCIDACDNIMGKMGYDPGLISYTTENRLDGRERHWLRPKLIGYGAAMVIMSAVFLSMLIYRVPLELDVLRDRGRLFEITVDGRVQNIYTLKILNMSRNAHRYRVSVGGIDGELGVKGLIPVAGGEILNLPTTLRVEPENLTGTIREITFRVEASDDPNLVAESESRFIAPDPQRTEKGASGV